MRSIPEQEKRGSGGRTAGILVTLLLFLGIMTVAFLSYQRSIDPSTDLYNVFQLLGAGKETLKDAVVQYAFGFDTKEKPVFTQFRGQIVKCSKSGIMFLDKTGEIVRSEGIPFNNPMVKTNGSLILIADIGARDVCVLDNKSVRWRDKTDAVILNADISEDGHVTVITAAKRDNNIIRVYEEHGVELFRKIIANDFAVSASISPTESYLVLSAISTGAVGPFSRYKIYDMKGNELSDISFDVSGELMPLFWHNRDESIFTVGDSAVCAIDMSGKIVWEEKFRSVAGAGLAGNGVLAVAAEGDEGTVLDIFSTSGSKTASTVLQGTPKGLDAIKGMVTVYTEDTVYFFDDRGNCKSRFQSDKKIKQVCLLDKNHTAVITDGEVAVVDIS